MLRQLFRLAAVHRPLSRTFYTTPLPHSARQHAPHVGTTTKQDPDPANKPATTSSSTAASHHPSPPSAATHKSPPSAASQQAPPPDARQQASPFDEIFDSDFPSPANDHVPDSPPRGPSDPQQPRSPSDPAKRKFLHELPKESIYYLHVFASRNNTILTLRNSLGNPLAWVSSGSCGFKHQQRSLYEAGHQCAVRMFAKIGDLKAQKHALMKLEILFRGFGQGREAVYRALMTSEGDNIRDMVSRLSDTTPLKIGGGTRARKAKRL